MSAFLKSICAVEIDISRTNIIAWRVSIIDGGPHITMSATPMIKSRPDTSNAVFQIPSSKTDLLIGVAPISIGVTEILIWEARSVTY